METTSFLEYLREHDATRSLAVELAEILFARACRVGDGAPMSVTTKLAS